MRARPRTPARPARLPLASAVAICLLAGCYPGRMSVDDERFKLRTALYLQEGLLDNLTGGTPTVAVLLSDSQLNCSYTSSSDPLQANQDVAVSGAGLLREGARTLFLLLKNPRGNTPGGEYVVRPLGSAPGSTRWAEAFYMEVLESETQQKSNGDYTYEVLEWDQRVAQSDGSVDISGFAEGALEGSFDLQDIGVEGRFSGSTCELDDEQLVSLFAHAAIFYYPELIKQLDTSGG